MPPIEGRRLADGRPVRIELEQGLIRAVQPLAEVRGSASHSLPWIAPPLCDLQINGIDRVEFTSDQLDQARFTAMCEQISRLGVGKFCPTVTTNSRELLTRSLTMISAAIDRQPELNQLVAGIHLEGPFISPEEGPRGAHPHEFCRPPDLDEFAGFQQASGNRIRLLTLSPEYPRSAEFIAAVRKSGVRVAIGHTAADKGQIEAAVAAGAELSTHLGNGAHANLPRHPNYLWDQLANDGLLASVIADGHHLPENVLRCFLRCKGSSRIFLVSDMTGLAGQPAGRYQSPSLGDVDVLGSGKLVVADHPQYLAGAALPLAHCVRHFALACELPLVKAWDSASHLPANWIGTSVGKLLPGEPADFLLLAPDWESQLVIDKIFVAGKEVEPSPLLSRVLLPNK